MNINLLQNGKYLLENKNSIKNIGETHSPFRKYRQFLSNFGLNQLIRSPTRVTTETSTLIDHVLVNSPEKISQFGVIDSGISDHNIVFCTRKITKEKTGDQRTNYDNFSDIDIAYSDFIFKLTEVIDKMAPMKQSKIKNNTQEWFDEEVAEKINIREKCFKKFKNTKLHVDEEIFKEAQKDTRNIIKRKKK